jgi:DNA-binding Xre family transcriptional regulator
MWRGCSGPCRGSLSQMAHKPALQTETVAADLYRRIATNLRSLREQRGWTQERLAQEAGLATRHLQKLEAAEVNVTLRTVARLCTALAVDVQSLFVLTRGVG